MDAAYINVIRRKDGKLVVHTAGTTLKLHMMKHILCEGKNVNHFR